MNLEQDLRNRWLPSAEQMHAADALLADGYDRERASGDSGVYTAHLLINKKYGFWTKQVELVFLDGVFLTRIGVFQYVHEAARRRYLETGETLTGGWAWHPRVDEAAVFEDIMSQFPER